MTHDPLCPRWFIEDDQIDCPLCDLIAKVRQDQCSLCCTKAEAAIAAAVEDFRAAMSEGTWYQSGLENGYEQGQRDMLAKCIEAVEAVSHDFYCASLDVRKPPCNCPQGDALDALRALQEQAK